MPKTERNQKNTMTESTAPMKTTLTAPKEFKPTSSDWFVESTSAPGKIISLHASFKGSKAGAKKYYDAFEKSKGYKCAETMRITSPAGDVWTSRRMQKGRLKGSEHYRIDWEQIVSRATNQTRIAQ